MKKTIFFILLPMLLLSCDNSKGQNNRNVGKKTTATVKNDTNFTNSAFDINKIPISNKELGDFPFFSFPKGTRSQNKPLIKSYDMLFFPINGLMTPVEGKVWKSGLNKEDNESEEWSLPYFLRSYGEAITAMGGVKIFDGKVSQKELDRIKDQASYFGEEGSIDYWNDPVKAYVIHRLNGDDVYIQLSGNSAMGEIQILQKRPFKQTITILKSDEIKKDLNEKGKAVLYINFDTDKATLKPDGTAAVKEIVTVLNEDKNLKLAINGYTDNTGDKNHNKILSEARATTVKNEIIKSGIASNRLTSKGFGQDNPIANNGTEDSNAKNRRVELVKQ